MTVAVFLMRVAETLPVGAEMDLRERRRATRIEAEHLLERHPVRRLWDVIAARL